MSETEAAAERVRKHAETSLGNSRIADRNLLARAYLSEHRPDDATPVTSEWLKASGMPFNTTAVGGGPSRVWNLLFDSPRGGKRVVVPVEAVPTRGDARAVCLGLGIPLTGDVQ